MKMEVGKVVLGASLLVIALFFIFAHNAAANPFNISEWTVPTDSTVNYAAGAVAGILGIAMLLMEFKKIKH